MERGTHQECDQQLPGPGYVRAEREWLAGTSSGTPEWNPRVAEDPLAVVLDQVRRHWLASQYIIWENWIHKYIWVLKS